LIDKTAKKETQII